MAMEKEGYREHLESLLAYFHKHWIYPKELADYMGVDYRTAMKVLGIKREGASIETIARRMCR